MRPENVDAMLASKTAGPKPTPSKAILQHPNLRALPFTLIGLNSPTRPNTLTTGLATVRSLF
jgi:hypothetical protein